MTIHELITALDEAMNFGMEDTEVVLFVHDGPARLTGNPDGPTGMWYRLPIEGIQRSRSEKGEEFFGAIEIVAEA